MSTVEIIIYSCLSFVSLSLAIGYLLKTYIPVTANANAIPYIKKHVTDERSVEIIIQQETIAAL